MIHDATPPELPPGLAVSWGDVAAGPRRGPKPRYTVAHIVEAAMALADTRGLAELSMPAVARVLGVTGNALYRYVSSKEELLILLNEAGWGPPPSSVGAAPDWRAASTVWVQALLERYRLHAWLLDMPVRGAPSTPHTVGWLEVLLESLACTRLDTREQLEYAVLLDGYARSVAHLRRDLASMPHARPAAVAAYLQPRLRERGFVRVAAAVAEGAYGSEPGGEVGAEFGLTRILDGLDALISRRRG